VRADIWSHSGDEPKVIGTVQLVNGVAVPSMGAKPITDSLYVPGPGGPPLGYDDGEAYIRALPLVLNGSFVRAEVVE
jgi:hypothetical protein